MKKLTALILTFALLFSFASCNKKNAVTPSVSTAFESSWFSASGTSKETKSHSHSETTEKHSAAVSATSKRITAVSTTIKKITTVISSTAVRKTKPSTTRRNYFPETRATTASTTAVTEKPTVTTTEYITEEEKTNKKAASDYIPIYVTTTASKNYCTISINCSEILSNSDKLKSGKEDFVPSNGEILKAVTVEFESGETVFDILCRVTQSEKCSDKCNYCSNGIQLEYEYTPGYENYYIEGIHQIYEKDCGSKSGWMYKVNGVFPNYGCSDYKLKNGDRIEFIYTCDLGEDIGADF